MDALLEEYPPWVTRLLEDTPVAALLRAQPISNDAESGVFRMGFEERDEFCNMLGVLQGGIVTTMLDMAMSFAAIARIGPEFRVPTLEMKTTFLAPARPGRLIGEGWPVRTGKDDMFHGGSPARCRRRPACHRQRHRACMAGEGVSRPFDTPRRVVG